jgi:hypothetical protein
MNTSPAWCLEIVGKKYRGYDGKVYEIESHDQCGFNIVEVGNPTNRRNISERAIGRTFHEVRA